MLDFGFYNMDCMEGMKDIESNSIDLVLTDIPYDGVNNSDDSGGLRKLNKDKADEITFDLIKFLEEVYRIVKSTAIIFCGHGQMSTIYNYFADKKNGTTRQLIWEKTNPSPMNGEVIYLSGIENAIWFKKHGGTFNARCKNTVFRFPSGSSEIHPTEKNHELLQCLIAQNSNVGDIVFDPCSGSGSTLICANDMGRKVLGFELNKKYYEKAKKRYDQTTSQLNIFDVFGYNPYQE